MLSSIHRSLRRTAVALAASVALVTTGLVSAHAAEVSISGTVALPAGLAHSSSNWTYVVAYEKVGDRWREAERDQVWYEDEFTISGLTAGVAYRLALQHGGYEIAPGFYGGPGQDVLPTATGSPLVTAPAAGLSIRAVRSSSITGTLAGATGSVRDSANVAAQLEGDADSGLGGWGTFTGHAFVVAGLHPLARYTLEVSDGFGLASIEGSGTPGPGIADGYYAGAGKPLDPRAAAAVAVPAGTQDLAVQVQPGATAAGTFVRSASGTAGVFSTQLDLYDPATGVRQDYTYAETASPSWPASTDDVGFTVGEIGLGTYKIGFNRESGPTMYVPGYYTGATTSNRLTTLADAVPVTVASGAAVDLGDLRLQTCASISGTLADAFVSSTADRNTQVVLHNDAAGLSARSWFGTGASFVVGGLVPGTYHVAVNTPDWEEHTLPDITITGCTSATGVTLGEPLASTALPVVQGSATVGSTLTVKAGGWSQPDVAVSRQWTRDGVDVPGATATAYVVGADDLGHVLRVRETASKAGFAATSHTSVPTSVVAPGALVGSAPTISGTAAVGGTLVAKPGTWSPSGTALTYSWKRGTTVVSTSSSYAPVAADVGQKLVLSVTASKPGYATAVKTATSPAVAAGTLRSTALPKISGTATVAKKLTATAGTWSSTVTTAYRWLRNGVAISGATSSSYTLTAADAGKKISVRVTASKTGYTTATATSTPTAVVARSAATATTSLSATTAKATSRVVVTVRLTTPGVAAPQGTVKIHVGSKAYSLTVTAAKKGKVTLKLPALKKGTYAITAVFTPSGSTATATTSATAKKVSLRIT